MRQSEVQYGAPDDESTYRDSSEYQTGRLPVLKRRARGSGSGAPPAKFFNPTPDPLPPAPLPYVVSERYLADSRSPSNFGPDYALQPNNFDDRRSSNHHSGSFSPPRMATGQPLPHPPHFQQYQQQPESAAPQMYSDSEEEGEGGPPEYLSGWHEPPKLLTMMRDNRSFGQASRSQPPLPEIPNPFPRAPALPSAIAQHIAATAAQIKSTGPRTPSESATSKRGSPGKARSLVVKFREDGEPASISGMSSEGDEMYNDVDPALDGGDYVHDPSRSDGGDDDRAPYERDQFEPPFIPKATRIGTGAKIAKSPETDLVSFNARIS